MGKIKMLSELARSVQIPEKSDSKNQNKRRADIIQTSGRILIRIKVSKCTSYVLYIVAVVNTQLKKKNKNTTKKGGTKEKKIRQGVHEICLMKKKCTQVSDSFFAQSKLVFHSIFLWTY